MSAYTDGMVTELEQAGSFSYESATAYAGLHGLSVRSVISKVKSLGLPYTPKQTVATAGPRVTKTEIVRELEAAAGVSLESFVGLEGADVRSLKALLLAIAS